MEAFEPDRDDVLKRARDAGIEAIITIGSDLEGNRGALALSASHESIYAAVGFHPHDAKDFTEDIFEQIREWASRYRFFGRRTPPGCSVAKVERDVERPSYEQESTPAKIVAIGEIGLDYHYDNSPREIQRRVFAEQLALARELDLPVIVHSREAKQDTLEIIADSGVRRGVFHCFSGDQTMAERAMALGFHISLAGPVTFTNAKKLREIARAVPDNFLLIETDAPYLAPEPFRGKRNEPAYLVYTAEAIATLRGVRLADVARITTLNAKLLFHIGRTPERGEIAYQIRGSLYLNITNRCTNRCSFCIRFQSDYVKGHMLRLTEEPTEEDVIAAIGDPRRYEEIVFCGYGEPLLRLELVKNVARWVKERGGRVRIDTNGHANLIYGRNVLPELAGLVDGISISLNAHDAETYKALCNPSFENAYEGVLEFMREAPKWIPHVQVTIVGLPGVDVEKCRDIAREAGAVLRVREHDVVG